MHPRVEVKTESDGQGDLIDRSSTEQLESPRDRHGRCLLLHSCDLRHHVAHLNGQRQQLETSSDILLPASHGSLPRRHWTYDSNRSASDQGESWSTWKPVEEFDTARVLAAAKQTILHLADHAGFDSVCRSPLGVLADVLGHFIRSLAREMRALADRRLALRESDLTILLGVLQQRHEADHDSDPLAVERYWIQSVWNVTVRRQRVAQDLHRLLANGNSGGRSLGSHGNKPPGLNVISVGNVKRKPSPSPPGPQKALLPMTAQATDGMPLKLKVSSG
eukprot:scpid90404/ scgid11235/ 